VPNESPFSEEVRAIISKEDDGSHMVKSSKLKDWDSFFSSAALHLISFLDQSISPETGTCYQDFYYPLSELNDL
jgi:hypothetical protein